MGKVTFAGFRGKVAPVVGRPRFTPFRTILDDLRKRPYRGRGERAIS